MNINVHNLAPTTSREELLDCFSEYGAVSDVSVSTYTVKGKTRASGLVEMPSTDQAIAAIAALQGQDLGGNLLEIQEG
jgi:RNA recognition motif-containing protein